MAIEDIKRPSGQPTKDSFEAFEVITRRGVGATASYEARKRLQFGFQKKAHTLSSLFRLHKDVASAYDGARGVHLAELTEANVAAAREISSPSRIRYGVYTSGCILIDIASAVLAAGDLTGVGLAVTIIIGIVITVFMWVYGRIILGKRLKRTKKMRQSLRTMVDRIPNDIRLVRGQYIAVTRYFSRASTRFPRTTARLSAIGSRIGRLTGRSRVVVRGVSIITRFLRWRPLVWIGENIPAVRVWPFWTIAAVATYIEHRAEFRTAQELLGVYNEGKNEVIGITDDTYQVQLDTIEQEIVDTSIEVEQTGAIATV